MFFRIGKEWTADAGCLVGNWPSGAKVILTGQSLEIRSDRERWLVRDPRATPSVENRRWEIDEQEVLSVSRSGSVIATASITGIPNKIRGNFVRLWDAATGAPLSPWLWHESQVIGASFSDDGWILTLTRGGRIRRWPADTPYLSNATWIDAIGEPISGMRLQALADVQPIEELELSSSRMRFRQHLDDAVAHGDQLAKWFQRRLRDWH